MTKLQELKQKLEQAITQRNQAKQFSQPWLEAKAAVEVSLREISEIEFVNRCKANPIPDDFVFVDWDTYDDD